MAILANIFRWMIGEPPPPANPFSVPGGAIPGLEAGAARRRLALWQPSAVHVNALIRNAGATVLARARWLVRNNGYAKAALRSWSAATVGAGIKPSSLIEDEALRESVQQAWLDWTDECDAEEVTDFYGLTRRVARETYLAGECFVRFRPRFPQDGLSVPLQLQLLPSEQLPTAKLEQVPNGLGNDGGQIRMGVEFDANVRDRRVAYWFYRSNPTDRTTSFRDLLAQQQLVRVPASEVMHVFDPVEAGQVRGLTNYAAAIVKLFMLDAYDDAELERQKQQASMATFIEVPEERDEMNMLVNQRPEDDPAILFPGAIVEGYAGEKMHHLAPPGVAGTYEPFQYRTLLQLSAATGIPYAELAADLNRTTYASSRAGLLAFRTEVEAFQWAVLVFQFLRRVWVRWMDTAVLAASVPITATAYNTNPARYRRMQAIVPRAPWVDPLKDRQAVKLALDMHAIAPQDAVEAEGNDLETVYRRIAEAKRLREKWGIDDPLPGWGSRVGQPTPNTAPVEPSEEQPTSEAA